jgi:hypothetical protein
MTAHNNHQQSGWESMYAEHPTSDVFKDDFRGDLSTSGLVSGRVLGPDEIRLVQIRAPTPSTGRAAVRCTTCIFNRNSRLAYKAVSYTWGSPIANDKRYSIELDGRERLLPKSLWRFLKQTCDMGIRDWLWIDALSIDQDSPLERSDQVQRMSETFGDAEVVVVWLGPTHGGSEKAIDIMMRTDPRTEENYWGHLCEGREEVYRLCDRPYWGRLWIYQELKSAKQIVLVCGNRIFSWERFGFFVDRSWTLLPTFARIMFGLQSRADKAGNLLWSLMHSTKCLSCADPRDRVYALLSSADSGHGLVPDYTISTTTLAKIVLRKICIAEKPRRNLASVLEHGLETAGLFGLEPESVFEITDGVLEGLDYYAHPGRSLEDIKLDIRDEEWAEDSSQVDLLRRWASSHDRLTVYDLLVQHMRPIETLL